MTVPESEKSATSEKVRDAIFAMLDFANLEIGFPRIVYWLRELPVDDRDRLLGELEVIAATDVVRRDDATYLLDGLRRIHWDSASPGHQG